jgi:hypothetical protein
MRYRMRGQLCGPLTPTQLSALGLNTFAPERTDWTPTRLGQGRGGRLARSEMLSGLDIPTVACVTAKANGET